LLQKQKRNLYSLHATIQLWFKFFYFFPNIFCHIILCKKKKKKKTDWNVSFHFLGQAKFWLSMVLSPCIEDPLWLHETVAFGSLLAISLQLTVKAFHIFILNLWCLSITIKGAGASNAPSLSAAHSNHLFTSFLISLCIILLIYLISHASYPY
jgi:hypothetical protein